MTKDEALKLALEALGILKSCKSIEIWCGAADEAVDAIREALAQPEQEPTRHCRSCGGTGERHTGVDESPTTICKPCDGTGQIAMAEQPAQLAQPEPVMDYDKEELRGTVWDTNKQSLVQPEQCVCGEPLRLNIVHRKDSPCFDYIERKWVGLTDEQIALYDLSKSICVVTLVASILKELNHD